MKKCNILGELIFFLLLINTSCSKKDDTIITPPPPLAVPNLAWSVTPTDPQRLDTAWYGEEIGRAHV